ncbi:MAG TPA: DGQHR domain-containing protein [Thermoanaerobaculia bacterium]|nr:DGQHR domain-containing protein [Thermoanaerobaculia bacterium]
MLSVPSLRLNQFGVRFYEALLSGADLQSLVGFEVLSFGPDAQTTRGKAAKKKTTGRVNWEFLEKRIAASEQAFQRPIIQRKIEELVAYYLQCADSGTLPAIPGSVLLVSDRRLEFAPGGGRSDAGSLKLPEESGILRALDGQHRLLALHQLAEKHNLKDFQVPAVVFDNLTADQVVELFVTINSKHTKLNPSHLISLSGRRLYRDDNLAAAHDVIRALNEDEHSPLRGQIKVLGIGRGSVTQASLADELRDVFTSIDAAGGRIAREFRENAKRFFLNYFKAAARAFPTAFAGRKYSIKSSPSLRAFIRIVPYVIAMIRSRGGDVWSAGELDAALRPWSDAIGDKRFETEGQWKEKMTGGTRSTVEILARELRQGLNA